MQLGQLDETFLRSRGCPWWPHYAIHFLPTVIVPYRQFVNECYHHHHLTGYMKISCHQSIILSTLEVRNHIFKCWKLSDCLPPPLTLVIWKKLHLWWPNKWYIRQRQRLYWYFHRFYQWLWSLVKASENVSWNFYAPRWCLHEDLGPMTNQWKCHQLTGLPLPQSRQFEEKWFIVDICSVHYTQLLMWYPEIWLFLKGAR